MSGGVDSAVTAYLLQKEGYEVCGVTLRTWAPDDGSEGKCCEIDDARRVSNALGIRFYPLNCIREFSQKVVDPFVNSYLRGETPNPCIECNRYLKWDKLLYAARVMEADYVATGHYAHVVQLENGRYTVKKAMHAAKDQTYMLYKLTQEQLAATLMPLGSYTKDQIRQIAEEASLPVAHKPDSQEICFVTDGHYADFIEDYAGKKNAQAPACASGGSCDPSPPSLLHVPGLGNFTHKGITHYTIGQRKGLGIALGRPVYVKEIRPGTDEVVLSDEPALFSRIVNVRDVNFLSIPGMAPGEQLRARAKVRYHHEASPALLEMQENGCIRITFDRPVRAAAPGQSSVFYDENDCVIGGGIIM